MKFMGATCLSEELPKNMSYESSGFAFRGFTGYLANS